MPNSALKQDRTAWCPVLNLPAFCDLPNTVHCVADMGLSHNVKGKCYFEISNPSRRVVGAFVSHTGGLWFISRSRRLAVLTEAVCRCNPVLPAKCLGSTSS